MTLKFEIRQPSIGEYSGRFYVGHVNRVGRVSLYLRNDGMLGPWTKAEDLDKYYFQSREEAEQAIGRFISLQ